MRCKQEFADVRKGCACKRAALATRRAKGFADARHGSTSNSNKEATGGSPKHQAFSVPHIQAFFLCFFVFRGRLIFGGRLFAFGGRGHLADA